MSKDKEKPMKILVTGATGLVGRELTKQLIMSGYQVTVVSRKKNKAMAALPGVTEVIECNLSKEKIAADLNQFEGVIHLMGESVASGRWNEKRKKEIYNSRILSTKNLVESFSRAPKFFISASAIGIYGERGDEILHEDSELGTDFLAKVCVDWEKEAKMIHLRPQGNLTRSVQLRTGLVLSNHGGALAKMLPAFRLGMGGALGDGRHWMSWIHLQDLVRIICFAIENPEVAGALNAVSAAPERNIDFSKKLAKTLNRTLGPRIPRFALKLLFGEMATILLSSQNVSSKKIGEYGFKFNYQALEDALK
ncbi:MAG: TIGR01777 family oxidoreductase [Bdellovibrionota bacterium]